MDFAIKKKRSILRKNDKRKTEIRKLFEEIIIISEIFPKMFLEKRHLTKFQEKKAFKEKAKINIDLVYNKFSRIETLLREIKEEYAKQLEEHDIDISTLKTIEYSFSDIVELTQEQYDELKKEDLSFRRLYIWIELYLNKIKELENIVLYFLDNLNDLDNYNLESFDKIIKDINRLYRQIKVVYEVLNNKAFTAGSVERKIKIK